MIVGLCVVGSFPQNPLHAVSPTYVRLQGNARFLGASPQTALAAHVLCAHRGWFWNVS